MSQSVYNVSTRCLQGSWRCLLGVLEVPTGLFLQTFCGPQIFLYPSCTHLVPQIFLQPTFFRPKIWTKIIFGPKVSYDPYFLGPKDDWTPNSWPYCPFNMVDVILYVNWCTYWVKITTNYNSFNPIFSHTTFFFRHKIFFRTQHFFLIHF